MPLSSYMYRRTWDGWAFLGFYELAREMSCIFKGEKYTNSLHFPLFAPLGSASSLRAKDNAI